MANLEFARHEIEEFVQSRVWKAIIADALNEVEGAQAILRTTDPIKDASAISRAQGLIDGLSWFVDHTAVMAEAIEYNKKKEEKDNDRRE